MERVRRVRSIRVAASGVVAIAAITASALAATGELTPQGCIEDSGQDECDEETVGLDSAQSVAVSADGKSVYAASAGADGDFEIGDDAIVRFKRER